MEKAIQQYLLDSSEVLEESSNIASYYEEVFLLQRYRNALIERLRAENHSIPHGLSILEDSTIDDMLAEQINLANPRIQKTFFTELKKMYISNDQPIQHFRKPRQDIKANISQKTKVNKSQKQQIVSAAPRVTISQQRLQKELLEKELKLRNIMNTKFRANPVPASSILPKYSSLLSKIQNKSMQKRNMAIKAQLIQGKEQVSNPTPKKEQKSFSIAKFMKPKGRAKEIKPAFEFKPISAKPIPNFQMLHSKFLSKLESKKKEFSSTISRPFSGLEMHQQMQRLKLDARSADDNSHEWKPTFKAPKNIENPDIRPRSTNSMKLKIETLKMKKEVEMLLEQTKMEIEEDRKKKHDKIKAKIIMKLSASSLGDERKRKAKLLRYAAEKKQMDNEYNEKLALMNEKLETRECLFEQTPSLPVKV